MWFLIDMFYRFRETELVKIGVIRKAFMGEVGLENSSGMTRQRRGKRAFQMKGTCRVWPGLIGG